MLPIPPTYCLLLTAKHKPYKKASLLTKNIEELSEKSLEERRKKKEENSISLKAVLAEDQLQFIKSQDNVICSEDKDHF